MGLSNELSCEVGSSACCFKPYRFFQSEVLMLYSPCWNPGLYDLSCSQLFLLVYPHANVGLPALPATALLPISAPPTSLDECFFFNSLVVRLPYSLIFWQFWLFFIFKFVVVLLLVVQGGKVYLPMPRFGRKSRNF